MAASLLSSLNIPTVSQQQQLLPTAQLVKPFGPTHSSSSSVRPTLEVLIRLRLTAITSNSRSSSRPPRCSSWVVTCPRVHTLCWGIQRMCRSLLAPRAVALAALLLLLAASAGQPAKARALAVLQLWHTESSGRRLMVLLLLCRLAALQAQRRRPSAIRVVAAGLLHLRLPRASLLVVVLVLLLPVLVMLAQLNNSTATGANRRLLVMVVLLAAVMVRRPSSRLQQSG